MLNIVVRQYNLIPRPWGGLELKATCVTSLVVLLISLSRP